MLSSLFSDDPVLLNVFNDRDRISRTQHRTSDSTGRVQAALLIWDPGCLPEHGADSDYGDETAGAVSRFKTEVLLVPPAELVDDVGPRTVERLDQLAAAYERGLGREVALVGVEGIDSDTWLSAVAIAESMGGGLLMTLGPRVMVLDGGQPAADGVVQDLGVMIEAVLTGAGQPIPEGLDADTVEALGAWLRSMDPDSILGQLQAWNGAESLAFLEGCGQQEGGQ